MPVATDLLTSPAEYIGSVFQQSLNAGDDHVTFQKKMCDLIGGQLKPEVVDRIPIGGREGAGLVRYRLAVRDMADSPEMYPARYVVKKHESREVRCGLLTDAVKCGEAEVELFDDVACVAAERSVYFCSAIPHETPWVKQHHDMGEPPQSMKRQALERGSSEEMVVKIAFESDEAIKLNDMIEVCGILSPYFCTADSSMDEDGDSAADKGQSLPIFHAISYRILQSSFPYSNLQLCHSAAAALKPQLISLFAASLQNDRLAAEYLLYHLLSSVYSREQSVLPIGKFGLNLHNLQAADGAANVSRLLEQLMPKSTVLPLRVSDLNAAPFIPSKDYSTGRLTPARLQMCAGTCLVIDETQLEAGQLDQTGIQNIEALRHLLQWQKVAYDFTYHSIDFATDINVLILSEGRTLLAEQTDYVLPITAASENNTQDDAAVDWVKLREYVECVKRASDSYDVPEDVRTLVQNDFVGMRARDAQNTHAEKLHSLLTLARLVALSEGSTQLTQAAWHRAKVMESLRSDRLEAEKLQQKQKQKNE